MLSARAFAIDSRRCHRGGDGRASLDLPQGWTAPGLFGGMAMACAVGAAEQFAEPGSEPMHPLCASALFHRPLHPGAADLEVNDLARTGRSWSVLARVVDHLTVTATLTPASELRALGPAPASGPAPEVPGPERLRPLPGHAGPPTATTAMSRQVDWRALTPWTTRGQVGPVLGWLRPRRTPWTAQGYLDPLWYMVAADLVGPGFFAGRPLRVATVSLDVQVLGLTRSPWLLLRLNPDIEGPWAAGRVELWDRTGRLVATASQRARLLAAADEDLPWSVTAFGSGACREI